jgi:hypothetical protein
MRARAVYETSNFERGMDPKDSMNIGMTKEMHIENFLECYKKLENILPEKQKEPESHPSYFYFPVRIGAYQYAIYYDLGEKYSSVSSWDHRPLNMKDGWNVKKEDIYDHRKYFPWIISTTSFGEVYKFIYDKLIEHLEESINTYKKWLEKAEMNKNQIEKYKEI